MIKTAKTVLISLLFLSTSIIPISAFIANCAGYTFEITNIPFFSIAMSVITFFTLISEIFSRPKTNYICILIALILPFGLISNALFVFNCTQIFVMVNALISSGCFIFLAVNTKKPRWAKFVSLFLSLLIILLISFLGFISLLFGGAVQNTVVNKVESPSGKYYAQVIDSDQGALGGNTFVDVYKKGNFNMIFIKFKKRVQRVYCGKWGEFENMQIYWNSDKYLVINSQQYKIHS